MLRHIVHALILALPMVSAQAVDWLPDRDVRAYCRQFLTRPSSPSGTVCLAWTQGFLEGMRSVKPARDSGLRSASAGDNDTAPEEEQRTHEREAALVGEFGPPARAGICLPQRPGVEDITRVVARGIVYGMGDLDDEAVGALRERYPCDVPQDEPSGGEPPT